MLRALAVTGPRSIDQMVEAAIWLMVQGDRSGAEELLAQVLRIDPTHERARQAMKSTGSQTSPGQEAPKAPIPNKTQPAVPPGTFTLPPESRTPMEPQPAHEPMRRSTLPGMGAASELTPPTSQHVAAQTADEDANATTGETPILQPEVEATVRRPMPTAPEERERTDRHLSLVPTQPFTAAAPAARPPLGIEAPTPSGAARALARTWSLEVLTGPHTGRTVALKKNTMFGRGLGALELDDDPFVSPGHASFVMRQGDLFVTDGGSASGTWVSIDVPTRIAPGGSFSAGLQRLKFLGPIIDPPPEAPVPYGAPRPAASWRLEHILVGGRGGRVWVLRGVITLGREGSHLKFRDDDSMAMTHVEMRPAGNELELIDRSARAGTFIEIAGGAERRLADGARVRIGSTVFRVSGR